MGGGGKTPQQMPTNQKTYTTKEWQRTGRGGSSPKPAGIAQGREMAEKAKTPLDRSGRAGEERAKTPLDRSGRAVEERNKLPATQADEWELVYVEHDNPRYIAPNEPLEPVRTTGTTEGGRDATSRRDSRATGGTGGGAEAKVLMQPLGRIAKKDTTLLG